MYLQEFFDYKNQVMSDLLTHEKIVSLLDRNIDMEDADKLVYTQVFPFEYVPQTVQEGKTYICVDVDIQTTDGKTYLSPVLYVWIFTHRDLLRLPGGGVRTDCLCSEISKVLNGSRKYGLGELNLHAVKRFAPMMDYNGKVMIFYAKDFNRQYDPNKPTPSNRRMG